jgi:hypothetical protein
MIPESETRGQIYTGDMSSFFGTVFEPIRRRYIQIGGISLVSVEVYVGTVRGQNAPNMVYAMYTSNGQFRLKVEAQNVFGQPAVRMLTAEGKSNAWAEWAEVTRAPGWRGVSEDWIRFRVWCLQPPATGRAIAKAVGFRYRPANEYPV